MFECKVLDKTSARIARRGTFQAIVDARTTMPIAKFVLFLLKKKKKKKINININRKNIMEW
jgi:hypothetical protein